LVKTAHDGFVFLAGHYEVSLAITIN
jgi:hypothetical protein